MELGVLVEPEAIKRLESIEKDKLHIIFNKIKDNPPLTLSEGMLDAYMIPSIHVKKRKRDRKFHSIRDWSIFINTRYEALKDIIMNKIDTKNLISINKVSGGRVGIIGLVRSKKDNIIDIEDQSGTLKVLISMDTAEKVKEDDVIYVLGDYNSNILHASDVVWPDVPLGKVNQSDFKVKAVFASNKDVSDIDVSDITYLLIWKCTGWEQLSDKYPDLNVEVVSDETNPCMIDIGGLNVLVYFGDEVPESVLKRRFINLDKEDFIVEEAPDIFFTNSKMKNYKGITILDNGLINLHTREVIV